MPRKSFVCHTSETPGVDNVTVHHPSLMYLQPPQRGCTGMHLAMSSSLYTLFQPSEIIERFLATEGCRPQKQRLLYWNLQMISRPVTKLRISIVQYLNTAPLVWGFTNGPLHGKYDLSFTVPSQCSEDLRTGRADIAISASMI